MSEQPNAVAPKWLLLLYQVPTHPSNARVKTWRRLQQIGAISQRGSAYVLPNTAEAREDFEWIRSEIVAMGGLASVFTAASIDGRTDDELVAAFRAARDRDYKSLLTDLTALERRLRSPRSTRRAPPPSARRALGASRDQLAAITAIDFFSSPLRAEAEAAIARVEASVLGIGAPGPDGDAKVVASAQDYRGRVWVTRPKPGVDRMASAWLIRTFIDPQAAFTFRDRPGVDEVPFDMYEGEFSHRGDLCTFEVLVQRFAIDDRAVHRIGEIVHDLDLRDSRFKPPEAATVGALVDGLRSIHDDDHATLRSGVEMFQALHRSMSAVKAVIVPPRRAKPFGRGRRRTRR
jgi:hypothetical protein